jgi:hypothetical protein
MEDTTATAVATAGALMEAHKREAFGAACQALEQIRNLVATLPEALAEFAGTLPVPSPEGVCAAGAARHAKWLVGDLDRTLRHLKAPGRT